MKLSTCLPASLLLAAAICAPAHGLAQGRTSKGTGALPPPTLNDPEFESALLREKQLMARRPSVSVARLDEFGVPLMRMDFHFGGKTVMPSDERALLDLADRFDFETGKDEFSTAKQPSEPALDRERNFLLGASAPVEGSPLATFFDPEQDLLVVFRPMQLALSCSAFTAINYTSYGVTGQQFFWTVFSDMTMTAVAPSRGAFTDPDLYLYWWNGSSYAFIASSTLVHSFDSVYGFHTSCYSSQWRLRVYLYSGGQFNIRASAFNAN